GFQFEIIPANIEEETAFRNVDPSEHVCDLAMQKAEFIAKHRSEPAIILGSDTIVLLKGEILNKPVDKKDAVRMLKKLSGKTHVVYTGIALVEVPGNRSVSTCQRTNVKFRKLSEEEIIAYVATGSPMDKAGAYGIQDDFGAIFIENIEGCYYNIVGLPLELLYTTLKKFIRN
ncbi:MAG: Maf family protein, partial [Bacteroidota bacterium]